MSENYAVCMMNNCRNRAPATEPFCAYHREGKRMTDTIHPAPTEFSQQFLDIDPILRYFHYTHLPVALQAASRPFCELASHIVTTLPRNAERTVALPEQLHPWP